MQIRILYHILILLFSLSGFSSLHSQDSLIKVLKKRLTTTKDNIRKCELLDSLVDLEPDDNLWPDINDKLIQLCQENLKDTSSLNPKQVKKFKSFLSLGYSNKGFFYQVQGNVELALDYLNKSLKISESINDSLNTGRTLNNIGGVYQELEDYENALAYHTRALEIRLALNDKMDIAQSYSNISAIYSKRNDLMKGHIYDSLALALRLEINDLEGIGLGYNNYGFYYKEIGDLQKAKEYFEKSLEIQEKIVNYRGIAVANGNIGMIYNLWKKPQQAKTYLLKSLEISQRFHFLTHIRTSSLGLYESEKMLGNYKKALEYHVIYSLARDSALSQQSQRIATKNKFQYEFDKKETELKAAAKAEKEKTELKAQEEEKRHNLIIIVILVGFLIVCVFTVFIYRALHKNKKANKIIRAQKLEVELQKLIVEEKQKEILDSIQYAKRIQSTLLPNDKYIERQLKTLKKP